MRRIIAALLVLIVLGGAATFIVYRVLYKSRPKTVIGWRAHVTTVAGDGSPNFRDAAQARQASFADPFGIAIAEDGTLFISDGSESNRIRKLSPDGAVTTFAGSSEGYVDGPGVSARFNTPSGLAFDSNRNLYVADTANNRIRKIIPEGIVSTVAGDGRAGYVDGPATSAEFNSPIGVAVDADNNVYVADTYNDRIRKISSAGEVTTLAGAGKPGYADGSALSALFNTPCNLLVTKDGSLIVADSGNNRLRKITAAGEVTTIKINFSGGVTPSDLRRPLGLALTHDGFLYATEFDRSRVVQIAPDGATSIIAGDGPGYSDGLAQARFNQAVGLAIDRNGDLYVADAGNYLVRKLAQSEVETDKSARIPAPAVSEPLPRLTPETLGGQPLLWPIAPQQSPHEVVATMGEVRGSFDSSDGRDHLHSGLDVFASFGEIVHAVRSEKVASPMPNWGFGDLNEGIRVGVISYIHLVVGRDNDNKPFDDQRFIFVKETNNKEEKLTRVRIRRGTRFFPGDALGSVNRMYHVHLNVGPPGAELNPLSLSPVGFSDHVAPIIGPEGIQLFNEAGQRLDQKREGRLVVHGRVRIVVDAFDRTDLNNDRRRLGLYRLGYQVLNSDGSPAVGFEQPAINILFNRLPADPDATKLAYAEASGITVYGSAVTRFLYEVTNVVKDGRVARGFWDTSTLPKGNYILRIVAADYFGNEAEEGRDVMITIEQ